MLNLPTPELNFFADLSVQVDKPQEVGQTHHGVRRLIPILGGTVLGNGWTARVMPGGADFQLLVNDRLAELDAGLAQAIPFWMSQSQFEYWSHTHLTVDVVKGRGSGFSVEAPEGLRFLIRSRLMETATPFV